jgi:hypothetical protein
MVRALRQALISSALSPNRYRTSEKDVLDQARFLVGFLGGGFLVFGLALVLEWRFLDVD